MERIKAIYFDMDGTIADLYGVKDWLPKLRASDTSPYEEARPLVNMEKFERLLEKLQELGYHLGVISWTSLNGSKEYNRAVRKIKVNWLRKHIGVKFDEIRVVKYGTRKDYVAKHKDGILFDDDLRVRDKWRGIAIDPQQIEINSVLENLVANET